MTRPTDRRRHLLRAALAGAALYAVIGALLAALAIDKQHFPFAGNAERIAIAAWWASSSALTGAALGLVVGLAIGTRLGRPTRRVATLALLIAAAAWMLHSGRQTGREPAALAATRPTPVAADTSRAAPATARDGAPNLVLVTVDTLRADHLGLHGYERDTSPALDAFAEGGAVFELAIAQAPATLRSMASLHTGWLPSAVDPTDRSPFVEAGFHTLAERLADGGYATGAFVTNAFLAASNGFAQGFETFHEDAVDVAGTSASPPTIDDVLDRALPWIAGAPRPFFAWIHVVDPHHPYTPQHAGPWEDVDDETFARHDATWRDLTVSETTRRLFALSGGTRDFEPGERDYLVGRYDAAILQVDRGLERLFSALAADGLDTSTVVAVTADHGEELGDHGRLLHGHTLYDELLHVPLVLGGPGIAAGARVDAQVRLVDLGPTLLDLAGIPAGDLHGRSLLPYLDGRETASRPAVAVREDKNLALRTDAGKLVVAWQPYESAWRVAGPWDMSRITFGREARRRIGLWRTAEDPGEAHDVLVRDRGLALRLYEELEAIRRAHPARSFATNGSTPGLTPDERAALEALGYTR